MLVPLISVQFLSHRQYRSAAVYSSVPRERHEEKFKYQYVLPFISCRYMYS